MPELDLLDDDSSSSISRRSASGDSKQTRQPTKHRNVLVIEDDDVDFEIIERSLDKADGVSFQVEHAVRLIDGLNRLALGGIHLLLLDLGLPDSQGLETFQKAQAHSPHVPIIVLSGLDDQSLAVQAVSQGAMDYLVKGKMESGLLLRSIDYARARHKAQLNLTRALESVQASEERFRSIAESANDAIILADDTGNIISWNPAAQTLFGYSEEEVLGKSLTTLMPERHRQPHTQGFERFKSTGQATMIGKTVEFEGLRKDGSEFPLELSLSTWKAAEGQFYCGIIRDVTERKRAEADRMKRLAAERDLQVAETEINIAREVQESLFPSKAPSLDGFDIAGMVFPAGRASGDYFDFIPLGEDNIGIIVGDVSGHGLGPAMMMVQTQAYLRALAQSGDDIGEILTDVNRLLCANEHGHFVSLFFGCLEPGTRSLIYASAGHRSYLLNASGEVTHLDGTGTVLALFEDEGIGCAPTIALKPGDLILIPTDGIQEAMSPDKSLFGMERTLDVIRANLEKPANEIIEALYHAARDFSEGAPQADDITAVVIKVFDSH